MCTVPASARDRLHTKSRGLALEIVSQQQKIEVEEC